MVRWAVLCSMRCLGGRTIDCLMVDAHDGCVLSVIMVLEASLPGTGGLAVCTGRPQCCMNGAAAGLVLPGDSPGRLMGAGVLGRWLW